LNFNQRYLIEEFAELYQQQRMERRELLRRALLITGSIPLAATSLFALGCGSSKSGSSSAAEATKPAAAATTATTASSAASPTSSAPATIPTPPPATGPGVTVDPNDPAIQVAVVSYKGPASDITGYLSRPRTGGPTPAVVVIHENRGLVEHTKDITRRYAKEGFTALAVDLLSRQGGTPTDQAAAAGLLGRANPDDLTADLVASVGYLKSQPFVKPGALGTTGFCMGGNFTFELLIASPDIKAAAPYYGMVRQMDKLAQTNAAVLAIYGGADTRVTSQSPMVEEKLKAAGKTYQIKIYEGAMHAFFNDTGGSYNADAAKDAWQLTLGWFRKYLGT
jgi:carboxymethylenebutenolidase